MNHANKLLTMGLSIVFTCLLTSCSEPSSEILVIDNVNGYSFDTDRQLFEFDSIAIAQGKVLKTGASLATQFPHATIIDGQNKTLIPGIIDAHGHVSSLGYTLMRIDVRDAASAQQAAANVAAYAADKAYLSWVRGRGWNQVLWPGQQFPTAAHLDKEINDRPVWLERVDGHAGWANSKALELAGIDSTTVSPPGGEIIKDSAGKPTGVLIDNAMNLVFSIIPDPSDSELRAALNTVSRHLLSLGITSTHDAGTTGPEHRLYKALADSGEMPLRIYSMISSTDPDLEQILTAGHSADANDFYSARSIKIYTDGALGSRGAAMLEPYSDRPGHRGLLLTSASVLRELFRQATEADFQVAIHAIGDKGNRIALDEIEYAYNSVGGHHLRHRIEHSQVVAIKDIPRFKMLNVIPSMQPTHATSDMNMAKARIGAMRLRGAYAWRSFLDQGSIVIAGSDYPVELANPFDGIHAAVTRQNKVNQPKGGWIPSQAMSLEEAMRAFSIDAAWGAHQESTLGGLTPGKWADFIVIDRDIYNVPVQDLWKTQVLETWLAGEKVYSKAD
ncbi:MAG: amidohydrolase [Porticoccaceae bacterium]|nr:amidohydrolase [Porticoccaceae bacterium]